MNEENLDTISKKEILENNDAIIKSRRYKNTPGTYSNKTKIYLSHLTDFDFITINLASPDRIRKWAQRTLPDGEVVGEIFLADTYNYRTFKPEINGLFCERTFGPVKNWECQCKKYVSIRSAGKICEKCFVELTESRVRRHRMGYIELMTPVTHLWYLKGLPSYISIILQQPTHIVENLVYFKNIATPISEESSRSLEDLLEEMDRDYSVHKAILEATNKKEKDSEKVDGKIEKTKSNNKQPKRKKKANKRRSLLLEDEKEDDFELFYSSFREPRQKVGAEILKDILDDINIEQEIVFERHKLHFELETNKIKKEKMIKRLRILESFHATETHPSWMILTTLPILPPDLRPMLELEGGRLLSADLNELYRTIINRNNRLYEMLEMDSAPDLIIRNEKRLLQEAVDCLIDNGKVSKKALSMNDRPLRSLSEIIEGKQGRFRQNLLGKRVDYSGRSVIVVGPNLRLNQCGLPYEVIIEIFQPHLIELLLGMNIAQTMKMARSILRQQKFLTLKLLELLLPNKSILLNRAPTLHRLGVQAFDPVVVPGQAIQLHPLVCTGFNADFDGDQMAIHLPVSSTAQLEVKQLIRAPYNFLSPSNGSPIIKPSQDIIIGCYYLTLENEKSDHISLGNYFSSFSEVTTAYFLKKLSLHTPIWVRMHISKLDLNFIKKNKKAFSLYKDKKNNQNIFFNHKFQIVFNSEETFLKSQYMRITPGRILMNTLLDLNINFGSKMSEEIIQKSLTNQILKMLEN